MNTVLKTSALLLALWALPVFAGDAEDKKECAADCKEAYEQCVLVCKKAGKKSGTTNCPQTCNVVTSVCQQDCANPGKGDAEDEAPHAH